MRESDALPQECNIKILETYFVKCIVPYSLHTKVAVAYCVPLNIYEDCLSVSICLLGCLPLSNSLFTPPMSVGLCLCICLSRICSVE